MAPRDGMELEIIDVSAGELAETRLLDFELQAPRPGEAANSYAFVVRGAVVARRDAPPIRWFSTRGAHRVTRGTAVIGPPADTTYSFSFAVGAAAQPSEFELELAAAFEDGIRTELARITGRRSLLRSPFDPTIQPLLITTLGRSGSTLLAGIAGSHPDVIAYRPFGREPRACAYWVDVFRELSDPSSSVRQLAHESPDMSERGWWLGRGTPQEVFEDDDVLSWLGTDHVASLAGYCQDRVESLYAGLAAQAGLAPRYFVEKARPDGITSTLRELYPGARELILVRDWRDMFCSMRAYSGRRGQPLFGREMHGSDEQHLGYVKNEIDDLMLHWDAAPAPGHLVRYEDLVLDPAATMESVLEYLELERSPELIATMSGLVSDSGPAGEAHRTTANAAESIGRWRRELSDDVKERCAEEFGPSLERLGYELR
jgi:hypothetical protein